MESRSSPCPFPRSAAVAQKDSGSLLEQGPIDVGGLAAKDRSLPAPTLVTSTQHFGETTTLLCVRRLALLEPNPNPNHNPNRDPPPQPKPALNPNLQLSRLLPWALTSALEGDHETRVASALETSLDRTLTLAEAPSPWGTNSNV